MSLINTTIKPFKAQAFHAGKFVPVTEANLKGKWSVVFFYPADFTFVCPTELGDLADHYDTFKALGVEIYSVSTDTHFTHKAWHDTSDTIRKISYPMIADPTGAITRNFEVMIEEGIDSFDISLSYHEVVVFCPSPFQFDIETQTLQFVHQHVKRCRQVRTLDGFALDDRLIGLGAT